MIDLSNEMVDEIFAGVCGPMTGGDLFEGGMFFAIGGPIAGYVWYRSYMNACGG